MKKTCFFNKKGPENHSKNVIENGFEKTSKKELKLIPKSSKIHQTSDKKTIKMHMQKCNRKMYEKTSKMTSKMEPKSHQKSIKSLLWGPSGCRDAPRVRKGRPKEPPDTKINQKSSKKDPKRSPKA